MPSPVVELLLSLLSHPDTTPLEHASTESIKQLLEHRGWTVTLQEVAPRRSNLLATRTKDLSKIQCVLNTHIDTVPPWIAPSHDDKNVYVCSSSLSTRFFSYDQSRYGRGSCDAKGSMAAMITAAQTLIDHKRIEESSLAYYLFDFHKRRFD